MGTYYNKKPVQVFKDNGYPNLYLDFAGNKSLKDSVTKREDIVTFTRTSEGTYYDSDRLLQYQGLNSIYYSEQFELWIWTKSGATISTNQAIAPNNTLTADKLVAGGEQSPTGNRVYQTGASINLKTVSVYAKAAEAEQILIRYNNDNDNNYLVFSLLDGSLISSGSNSYNSYITEDAGNGWWRFSVTSTPSNQSIAYFAVAGPTGLTGKGIYLWGAQLEKGGPTQYVKTSGQFRSAPRFDHSPSTGESLGLLVEPQRTNLVINSNNPFYNHAQNYWGSYSGGRVTSGGTISGPGGIMSEATVVRATIDPGPSYVDRQHKILSSSLNSNNTVMSFKVIAKSLVSDYMAVSFTDSLDPNTQEWWSIANVSTGELTQAQTNLSASSIEAKTHPNGYVEIQGIVKISDFSKNYSLWIQQVSNPDNYNASTNATWSNGDDLFALAYAGIEIGTSPSSPIITNGSFITRAADVVSIDGDRFTEVYNNTEWTCFAETIPSAGSYANSNENNIDAIFSTYGTASFSAMYRAYIGTSNNKVVAQVGFSPGGFVTSTAKRRQPNNFIGVYNSNSGTHHFSLNGYNTYTYTYATALAGNIQFGLGRLIGYNNYLLCGHYRKFVYWPSAFPSGSLQTITEEGL